ncbi:hypothetical protein [Massilia sp. H6]|uniref:hypothetical protein n=1 Tax=Massilia sp. H6 TaxID=2970464 RepID=UPI002168B9FA|nr:hypothetical protein [Massilia sp. H6]UVW30239.1 hypothetical protein NRS07_09005 [Massilia sp. H6]
MTMLDPSRQCESNRVYCHSTPDPDAPNGTPPPDPRPPVPDDVPDPVNAPVYEPGFPERPIKAA